MIGNLWMLILSRLDISIFTYMSNMASLWKGNMSNEISRSCTPRNFFNCKTNFLYDHTQTALINSLVMIRHTVIHYCHDYLCIIIQCLCNFWFLIDFFTSRFQWTDFHSVVWQLFFLFFTIGVSHKILSRFLLL